MPTKIKSLNLNKKNRKKYIFFNSVVFFIIFLSIIFLIYKVIFPSQYFTYSFNNINSLKNTITDMSGKDDTINFFASTPLDFSQIKIDLILEERNKKFENKNIKVQKSYKAFFYPESEKLTDLSEKRENHLVSIDNSVYIIGNEKKTPIDSVETFESLGYAWKNVQENQEDLSNYEKQKLADLNAAHPDGTIFKTREDSKLYFIENQTKREIENTQIENIKNPIEVDEKSLNTVENCSLEKSFLSNKKYSCTLPVSQLNNLIGKDYKLSLENISNDLKIKRIDLEFKKVANWNNFKLFLFDLKKKILYRFGIKDFQ